MLVNPVSFRIGISTFWRNTWSIYKTPKYRYLIHLDILLYSYITWYSKKFFISRQSRSLISHIRIYNYKNNKIISFFYYNTLFDDMEKSVKHLLFNKKQSKINILWNKRNLLQKKQQINNQKDTIIIKELFKTKKGKSLLKKINNSIFRYILYIKTKYKLKHIGLIRYIISNINKRIKKIWKKKKHNWSFFFNKEKYRRKSLRFTKFWKKKVLWKEKIVRKKKVFLRNHEFYKWRRKKLKKKKKYYGICTKLSIYLHYKKIKKKISINRRFKILNKKYLKKEKIYIYLVRKQTKFEKYFFSNLQRKKILFIYKYFLFNILMYCLVQIIKKKKIIIKYIKQNIQINLYKLDFKNITSSIITKYIYASLTKRYGLWESIRPVMADLNKRILAKELNGFKVAFSGRFKRTQRAVYIWRKNGKLGTSSNVAAIDYSIRFLQTKYGVSAIKIWLSKGTSFIDFVAKVFPLRNPFFFKKYYIQINGIKISVYALNKNSFYFKQLLKDFFLGHSYLKQKYYMVYIKKILYNYIYNYVYLKELQLKINKSKFIIKKIFLPHYLIYKLNNNVLSNNGIQIIPILNIKYLKRINIRKSYKLSFFNKIKYKLKLNKCKIYL